jgi:RNA polymerase sigma-70 factor (ECF subfamily)
VTGDAAPGEGGDVADLVDAADRDAVERTMGGDSRAFAGIVQRHGAALTAVCSRMVADRSLGEELAQEALARTYSSLGSWRGDGRFRHWLYRIAMNCCRDYMKAGARAERPAGPSTDEPFHTRHPERELQDRELAAALEAAIARLPPANREAFVLFHTENLDYEQIHAITGVSVSALKVRVHRARLVLKEALANLRRAN